MKISILLLHFFIVFNSVQADDSINCSVNGMNPIDNIQENFVLNNIEMNDKTETAFCFDTEANKDKKELMEDYEMLNLVGMFDSNHCLVAPDKRGDNAALISKFIQKSLDAKLVIYATTKPDSKQANLIITNSENKKFVSDALTSMDKWKIAGYSTAAITVGALISEKAFKGEADKRKHWMVGATISGVTTGTTYLLLETLGLGDKLKLSREAKKNIIMYSGPIMGTVVGLLKEVYDTRHRDKHTPDIKDAAATSLGAGVSIFAINMVF